MVNNNRWLNMRPEGGELYDAKFAARQKAGLEIHGEANFVERYHPKMVLDAGCGTGRVAIALAERGCAVVGVDIDPTMLARAQTKAPTLDWRLGDLASIELSQQFELIVLAGNVILFVTPNSEVQVLANLAAHLVPGGRLVAGFELNHEFSLAEYDEICATAGLVLRERYATWERQSWYAAADYAVSVHQRA